MTHTPYEPSEGRVYTPTISLELAPGGTYIGRWQDLINDNLTLIDTAFAAKAALTHAAQHMSAGGDPIRLDELKVPTDVTTLNASTSVHGLAPKAVAATQTYFMNYLGIANGETTFTNKPLFDQTAPAAVGTTAAGTATTAAHRDHVHPLPASTGPGRLLIGKTNGLYDVATLTAGTNVSITNGEGTISIAASGGGAGLTWEAASASFTGVAGKIYLNTNTTSLVTMTLPSTGSVGDTIGFAGLPSSFGWEINHHLRGGDLLGGGIFSPEWGNGIYGWSYLTGETPTDYAVLRLIDADPVVWVVETYKHLNWAGLQDLADVGIGTNSPLAAGDFLTYDGTAQKWVNLGVAPGGGATTLNGLNDVEANYTDGYVLTYVASAGRWQSAAPGGTGGGGAFGQVDNNTSTNVSMLIDTVYWNRAPQTTVYFTLPAESTAAMGSCVCVMQRYASGKFRVKQNASQQIRFNNTNITVAGTAGYIECIGPYDWIAIARTETADQWEVIGYSGSFRLYNGSQEVIVP